MNSYGIEIRSCHESKEHFYEYLQFYSIYYEGMGYTKKKLCSAYFSSHSKSSSKNATILV